MIKAIPTFFNGVQYKSRLEARWSLFFDLLDVIHMYEPFTIQSNGIAYTPDFYIHGGIKDQSSKHNDLIVEIKPKRPNDAYLRYLMRWHNPAKTTIVIFYKDVDNFISGPHLMISGIKGRKHSCIDECFINECEQCKKFVVVPYHIRRERYCLDCASGGRQNAKTTDYAIAQAVNYRFDL